MAKNIKFKQIGIVAAVVAATMCAVQPAMADSLTFNGLYYSGADIVTINNASINEGPVYSGGFSMTDTTGAWTMGGVTTAKNASFMAWCIDIYDHMKSTDYTLYGPTSFNPVSHDTLTPAKISALDRLASNDLSKVTDAKTSSAFQLAAWEIMAETTSTLNVGNGTFYVKGDALGADTLANSWLANLYTATPTQNLQLYIWTANIQGSTQDLAVFAPVPEPETYAMMLAGLGLLGGMARWRKATQK